MERNHKDIFADKRLLSRFLKQVYSAYNTPSLITLVAQDDNYIELCGFISNTNKNDNPKLFQYLDIECQKHGFDIYTIQLKLNPVSTALGLVKSSKMQLNYYDLLGVEPSADMADIRKAYRELARKTHPDTGKNGDSKAFVELNEAYQTLIDPDLRYYYDQSRQNRALWNEQSDRPQKQKKKLRSLYQIGLILIFFVFAAYLSDIVFHQKAITDDPYSKKVNDEAKLEGKKVIHNEKNEFKDRQKALVGKSTSAVLFLGDSRRVEEGMPGPKRKSNEVFSQGPAENGRIPREKQISLETSTRKRKTDDPIEDKVIAGHAIIEGPVLGVEKKDKEASEGSSGKTSQEGLLASVNFMGVESSGVHSERLSKEDVHIIEKDTDLSVGISKDTPKALSVSRRDGIVSKVSRAAELIESRESQLKRLARLSADKSEKEINATIQNQATKEKTARKPSPKRLSKEDVHIIEKDTNLSVDIQEDASEVLLTLGQADISTELSGLEEQAEFRKSPLKRLASLKAAEEKQQLNSRLNAFLRSYCREYENKDIEKFSKFFAPDAIEKGKPFTKLIYKYKKNFKVIKDIKYAIRIGSYSKEAATESIFLTGNFSLNWRMNDGSFNESTGNIYFTLHENGDSFLVKRLDYTFKK